ncbi:hypothetical protein C8R45DRAFT_823327, partial [Mycena sanguinolenta]
MPAEKQRTALAQVKLQITRYKEELVRLEETQRKLEANLSRVVYPVSTLPPDITSYIFLHCLPTHGRVTPSPAAAPLLLAQICRHWRQIALSTCRLWSSLYIDPGDGTKRIVEDRVRMLLETWFSRAKGTPLSLGLNFTFQ